MKVAIVGVGGIAKVHLQAYKRMTDIRVTAFVDAAPERLQALAAEWNVPVYRDYDEMLASTDIDAVDICAPTHLHEHYAVRAMNAGKHVICEKPIAVDAASGEAMLAAARKNGVCFMVAHVVRFWPEYEYLKRAYDEGFYGALRQVAFSRISKYPEWSSDGWMLDEAKSGLAPIDLHIHDADFIRYMLGEPKSVTSRTANAGPKLSYIRTDYEYDGIAVEAEGGWYPAKIPFRAGYRAAFERGVLEYRDGVLTYYGAEGQPMRIEAGEQATADVGINVDAVYPYYAELRYFYDCIAEGVPPAKAAGESSLQSLRTVLAELDSAKSKRTAAP